MGILFFGKKTSKIFTYSTKADRICQRGGGAVERKSTDDMRRELMQASDLNDFLSENQENFNTLSVQEALNHLFRLKGISKAALAKQAGISEVYLHQVFAGRRNPSRNRLLCLCFGLSATLDETQELLRRCGHAPLYPKDRRDAVIAYGLLHHMSLFDVNDKLFLEDEETLF